MKTRLEAIRARRAVDGDLDLGWKVQAEKDRAWLLARVDALAEALRAERWGAPGARTTARDALDALSEDEST